MFTASSASEPRTTRADLDYLIARLTPSLTDGTIVLDALRWSDAAALAAMDDIEIRRAFGAADPTTPLSVTDTARLIEAWSTAADQITFAIRRGGSLVGVATARFEVGGWVATMSVLVAPSARRAKVGTRALRLLADFAVDVQKASRLRLDSLDANKPAHRLAESLGFKRLDHFPGGPGWTHHGLTHEEWEVRSQALASSLGEGTIAA